MTPFGDKAVAEIFLREVSIARKMIERVCNLQSIVLHRSLTNLTAKDFGYCVQFKQLWNIKHDDLLT